MTHSSRAVWVVLVLGSLLPGCVGTRYIFSSTRTILETPDAQGLTYREVWVTTPDDLRLHAWYIPGQPGGRALVFFHGNAANISHRIENLRFLHELGLTIFIFDYRGFGLSEGTPTREAELYVDGRSALAAMRDLGWESSDLVYYGRSLGASVALQLALEEPPAGLVLECPFTSLADVAWQVAPVSYALFGWWAIEARFDNLSKVPGLTVPLIVFQGDLDTVTPLEMAQRLFARAPEPKTLYVVRGARHSNAYEVGGEGYRDAWRSFLGSIPGGAEEGRQAAARPGPAGGG